MGEVVAIKPSGAGKVPIDLGEWTVAVGLVATTGTTNKVWVATSAGMLTGCSVYTPTAAAVSAQPMVNGVPTGLIAVNAKTALSQGATFQGAMSVPFAKGDLITAQVVSAASAITQTFTVSGEAILSS